MGSSLQLLYEENNKKTMRKTHPELAIEQFEKDYPNLAEAFKKLQKEQYETFSAKMNSYGLGNISMGTNLESQEEKKLSITSVWIRCMDKMNRLKNLVLLNKENFQADESIEDSWKDLSVYGMISQLVMKGQWKK